MKIAYFHRHAMAVMLVFPLFMAACSDADRPRVVDIAPTPATANVAAPPTVVGTVPAGPTKEAPATTSAAKSDISKDQESSAMPLPKQANDDSAPVQAASQRVKTSTP